MERRDWLERLNFRPTLQDSRDNPFLRECLPKEDMRPLERASIATTYAWPLGLIAMGSILGPHSWMPSWLLWIVATGSFAIWFRASRRIDASWRKALNRYQESDTWPASRVS
jgi:hypothetical protein